MTHQLLELRRQLFKVFVDESVPLTDSVRLHFAFLVERQELVGSFFAQVVQVVHSL